MKKLLIIGFVFVSFNLSAQTHSWDSSQGIIYPTDTTLKIPLSATDTIYGYDVDTSDANNEINYINRRSAVKLIYDFSRDVIDDTIPAVCLFQNYNFDSLFYSRIEGMTINSDSTLNKPQRITEFKVYSSASGSSIESPFELTPTMHTVCASGCDYASGAGALAAASTYDTILYLSGNYNVGTSLNIALEGVRVKAVGSATLTNTAAQTNLISINANNVELSGFNLNSTASTYGIYIVRRDSTVIKNNYITGASTYSLFLRGENDLLSTIYVENNVLDCDLSSYVIRNQDCNTLIRENYFTGSAAAGIRDQVVLGNQYRKDILYNKSNASYSDLLFTFYYYSSSIINYNDIYGARLDRIVADGLTSIYKYIEIKGNAYVSDSTSATTTGFLKEISGTQETKYVIKDNNVRINNKSESIAVYLTVDRDVEISGNTFDIYQGTNMFLAPDNEDSILVSLKNNKFYQRYSPDGGGNYNVSFNSGFEDLKVYDLLIENNEFRNPFYYGSPGGGHTCLYLGNIQNRTIRYNNFTGAQEAAVIDKGVNTVSEGIETVKSSYYDNVYDSCPMIVKGVRNIKLYNNTFIDQDYRYAIQYYTNTDDAIEEDSRNGKVYNNIVIGTVPALYVKTAEDSVGFESDNNVFYGNDSVSFVGVGYEFNEWQSLGFGENSLNTNPNLKSLTEPYPVSPSSAIGNGINLGDDYKFGLDITTSWTDNIVLKEQSDSWTIGAYVVPKKSFGQVSGTLMVIGGKALYFER